MELWMKIVLAAALGYMAFRLWPAANQMLKHGPKGTADDWKSALVPLLLVIAFVAFLIMAVKG